VFSFTLRGSPGVVRGFVYCFCGGVYFIVLCAGHRFGSWLSFLPPNPEPLLSPKRREFKKIKLRREIKKNIIESSIKINK
jgi:hypothetical protein